MRSHFALFEDTFRPFLWRFSGCLRLFSGSLTLVSGIFRRAAAAGSISAAGAAHVGVFRASSTARFCSKKGTILCCTL
jgi:hypothetical protein